jgi:hypothetical protein
MAEVLDREADLERNRGRPARARLKGPRSNPDVAEYAVPLENGGSGGALLSARG